MKSFLTYLWTKGIFPVLVVLYCLLFVFKFFFYQESIIRTNYYPSKVEGEEIVQIQMKNFDLRFNKKDAIQCLNKQNDTTLLYHSEPTSDTLYLEYFNSKGLKGMMKELIRKEKFQIVSKTGEVQTSCIENVFVSTFPGGMSSFFYRGEVFLEFVYL